MIRPIVILFVFFSGLFALTHIFAMEFSLYWYYWWFDNVMHFWGGLLLGLGTHVFCTFSRVPLRATLGTVLVVLLAATLSWEVFERSAGLFNPETYLFDTAKDIIVGFSGGLLSHLILQRLYNRRI